MARKDDDLEMDAESQQKFTEEIRAASAEPQWDEMAGRSPNIKPRYDLIPTFAIHEVALLGAERFGEGRRPPEDLYAEAQRQMNLHTSGSTRDPEFGLTRMAHAAWCLLQLTERVPPKQEYESTKGRD